MATLKGLKNPRPRLGVFAPLELSIGLPEPRDSTEELKLVRNLCAMERFGMDRSGCVRAINRHDSARKKGEFFTRRVSANASCSPGILNNAMINCMHT